MMPPLRPDVPGNRPTPLVQRRIIRLTDLLSAPNNRIATSLQGMRHVNIGNRTAHPLLAEFDTTLQQKALAYLVDDNSDLAVASSFDLTVLTLTDLYANRLNNGVELVDGIKEALRGDDQWPYPNSSTSVGAYAQGGIVLVSAASMPLEVVRVHRPLYSKANYAPSVVAAGAGDLGIGAYNAVFVAGVETAGFFGSFTAINPTNTAYTISIYPVGYATPYLLTVPALSTLSLPVECTQIIAHFTAATQELIGLQQVLWQAQNVT